MEESLDSHLMSALVSVALPAMGSRHLGQMQGERLDLGRSRRSNFMLSVPSAQYMYFILSVARQSDSLANLTHQVAVPALEDPGGRRQLLQAHLGWLGRENILPGTPAGLEEQKQVQVP